MSSTNVFIIGISAVSGGGKTAVTRRLTEDLGDAVALHFDDYDDTNVHPDSYAVWFDSGADYDAFETPVFTSHLEALKAGRSVPYPVGDVILSPARYVVADAPLGRAHADSGQHIDFMVYVDTPLDVAMARRTLRDIERETYRSAEETVEYVKDEMAGYLRQARPIYVCSQSEMRSCSDLVVDGTLSIDDIVEIVRAEIEELLSG